ncbi:MAG TPA: circularly permuted type 2 ATP-grasp protein, partial [Calditrichia bacterium]|nr:circularly permuted type 2 ATP-grasp protein [Calditrichia bacterium]
MNFNNYNPEHFFDEMFESSGATRSEVRAIVDRLNALSREEIRQRQTAAELALLNMGITFSVYGDEKGLEKIFPFDIIPRIIPSRDWQVLEAGLRQRIQALNLFIADIYKDQRIIREKIIPREVIESCSAFRRECMNLQPPNGVWCHITGTDIIRAGSGEFMVLEDNLRCPSGVSYVLENRSIMKRVFPQVFESLNVRPVDDYSNRLLETLQILSPREKPTIVVLTPGKYNSAYFEHSFLARQMGVELVEGQDLVVKDDFVFMRTTRGFEQVDVIYRRIDDDFLDPTVFRADSVLGIPGLMQAYRKGHVALANAPGTGVADDKVVYSYVPEMVRFYLTEEPILANVPTYRCFIEEELNYTLDNLSQLVVKTAGGSGGYGMLVGPHASQAEIEDFRQKVKAEPRNYIAQPTISLSRVPTIVDDRIEGRHVDLRPYILFGEKIFVMPGGLTRVALKKGSLVVNSSQGGGSKDTWVLGEKPSPGTG